jgi:hypothetical protein
MTYAVSSPKGRIIFLQLSEALRYFEREARLSDRVAPGRDSTLPFSLPGDAQEALVQGVPYEAAGVVISRIQLSRIT